MKTALITGGSQGLGKVLAKKLAKRNYQVLLLARRERLLKQVSEEIGHKSSYYVCDIRQRDQVKQVIVKISKQHSELDLLVNNAGVWVDDDLRKKNPEKMVQAVETNLLGQIHVTEACLPLLERDQVSRIFTVISSAGVCGIPAGNNTNWKSYGASKWGLRGYTDALREDLRETNIQLLQFFPGGFESSLYENANRDNPHDQPWMMKTEDVADVALFAIRRPDDVYMEKIVVSKHMN
jgi:NADP-dependent 3-hydroxy acid dehydrogenase YdfG